MTVFRPAAGLDALIARMIAPHVDQIAEDLATQTRRAAPDAKRWVTQHDDRVRPTHQKMEPAGGGRSTGDLHMVPANLRYQVPRPNRGNDVGDQRSGYELAEAPRDEALSIGNRINCRCSSVPEPGAIAAAVSRTRVKVVGATVRATVVVEFHRVAESEFPDPEDGPGGWMRGAVRDVASRRRR